MIIGYARVSTDGQTLDAQRASSTQCWRGKGYSLRRYPTRQ
jgi:DNA invertase Pin-like site-specific DNA recombinase